jgi:hypothetical protein
MLDKCHQERGNEKIHILNEAGKFISGMVRAGTTTLPCDPQQPY